MENKIITLNNNEEYLVLKDLVVEGKRYIFCSKYTESTETIEDNEFVIAEVTIENNNVVLNDINDEALAQKVTTTFLEEMKKTKDAI